MSLRVLYITNEDRQIGGSSLSLETLLSCVGDAVEPILLFREAGPVRDRFAALGYRCLVVPYYRASFQAKGLSRVLRWLPHFFARAVTQRRCVHQVRRQVGKVDLVHSNSATVDIGPRIARALGVPHVWHIREYPDTGLGLRFFPSARAWRRKLLSSDAVVAITPGLLRHLGLPVSSLIAHDATSGLRAEEFCKTNLGSAQAPPRGPGRTARLQNSSATPACGSNAPSADSDSVRTARLQKSSATPASGSNAPSADSDSGRTARLQNSSATPACGMPAALCIPDAVLPAAAAVLVLPKAPEVVFLAGTLAPHKRPDEAIEIFARASLPEPYRLVLAGEVEDGYRRKLQALAEALGASERVEFRPFTADVRALLGRAAAVLVCTAYEGMGRVAVEALFYGCPVIARGSGGSRDVLAEGLHGSLYDTPEQAAAALRAVVSDFPEAQVRAAADYAAATFSTDSYGARILSLYRSLSPST